MNKGEDKMFCQNCGKKVPDGSKFCDGCGAKLLDDTKVANNNEKKQSVKTQKKKKKPFKGVYIAIAVFVVLAVGVVMGKKFLTSSTSENNGYVYLSNGKYEYMPSDNSDEVIELGDIKDTLDDSTSFYKFYLVNISDDKQYVYFFVNCDFDKGVGTLCRAELKKLKPDSEKNKKYIEIIDTNVAINDTECRKDKTIIYTKADSSLYYYDGEKTNRLADKCTIFRSDDSNYLSYSVYDYDNGTSDYYSIDLNNIGSGKMMAGNTDKVVSWSEPESIVFGRYGEDETHLDLYSVTADKPERKIAENTTYVGNLNGKVYYTVENGEKLSLYDYVDDENTEETVEAPNPDDYQITTYRYDMIGYENKEENQYGELYTSCTEPLYWFGGDYSSRHYSMEEALDITWIEVEEKNNLIISATKEFIDTYGDLANDDGFIKVTDDVKQALQKINASYSDRDDNEWLELCYEREEDGTKTDYEALNNAQTQYRNALNVDEMRKELKSDENAIKLRDLYCYSNGETKLVSKNVINTSCLSNAIIYNTMDMMNKKMDIADCTDISDVVALFDIDYSAENYLLLENNENVLRVSENASEILKQSYSSENTDSLLLESTDSKVYLNLLGEEIYEGNIENGEIDNLECIAKGSKIADLGEDGTLYYWSNQYQYGDINYGDLYEYKEGQEKRLAQDIIQSVVYIYDDGVILAWGSGTGDSAGVSMIDSNGDKQVIADGAQNYLRIGEKSILYLSNGELYRYDDQGITNLGHDVEGFWGLNGMEPIQQIIPWE